MLANDHIDFSTFQVSRTWVDHGTHELPRLAAELQDQLNQKAIEGRGKRLDIIWWCPF